MSQPSRTRHRAAIALNALTFVCGFGVATTPAITLPASAQTRLSAESLAVAPLLPDSVLGAWGSSTLERGRFSFTFDADYARRPLTVRDSRSNAEVGDLVGSISTYELMATAGVWDRVDVTLGVPIHRVSAGSDFAAAPPNLRDAAVGKSSAAFGDIRIIPRVTLLGRAPGHDGLGVAALVPAWLPTGDAQVYAGESFRIEPRIAVDYTFSRVHLLGNLGYLFRSKTQLLGATVDDMLTFALGASFDVVQSLSLLMELSSNFNVLADKVGRDDLPTELLFGLRFAMGPWAVQLGGAPGMVGGVTEPAWRMLGALSFTTPKQASDREPEGTLDVPDACCRETDNDADGIPDATDACPNVAGQPSSDPSRNGCADRDRDHDGILDARDACPDTAGVASERAETNGCPAVSDRDGDTIADPEDACPDVAGRPSPVPSANGCPAARIQQGQIMIEERVEFENGSAQLVAASEAPLRAVQELLAAHPEITQLEVEGHTDNMGKAVKNLRLSRQRAQSVRTWLVEHGIDLQRLQASGLGSTRPTADNATPEGRTRNRRVEFHILGGGNTPQ